MSRSGLRQDDSGGVLREHWRQRFGKHEVCPIPGMPPLKWSTFWDMIIPFSGGLNDGWKAREARGYRAEVATG